MQNVQLLYHSRGNGQVEHANRSVQALLRRLLLHAPNIDTLDLYVAAVQLALNSTASHATGFPANLQMFGSLPPTTGGSQPPSLISSDPSAEELRCFGHDLQARTKLLSKAATMAHVKYRAVQPTCPEPRPVITPGTLALLYPPHMYKLFVLSRDRIS